VGLFTKGPTSLYKIKNEEVMTMKKIFLFLMCLYTYSNFCSELNSLESRPTSPTSSISSNSSLSSELTTEEELAESSSTSARKSKLEKLFNLEKNAMENFQNTYATLQQKFDNQLNTLKLKLNKKLDGLIKTSENLIVTTQKQIKYANRQAILEYLKRKQDSDSSNNQSLLGASELMY
jgi:hypothetical protein